MKKIILMGLFGVFALASCKKDYSCKCLAASGGDGERNIDFQAKNESDAEAICAAEEGVYFGITFTCKLE
ncbi:MAG: hypothetical protein AB8B74_04375 [Crocinitomicaceae bacterium]